VRKLCVAGLLLLGESSGVHPVCGTETGASVVTARSVSLSAEFEREGPAGAALPVLQIVTSGYGLPLWLQGAAGGRSAGANAVLEGSVGQTGSTLLVSAAFRLDAGFWPATRPVVFLDGFESGDPSSWSATAP